MTYIQQLPVEEFIRRMGGNLYETLLNASSQPPTPPTPPTTPFDAYPPNPNDFGFYVSFRFDQFLQKKIGPDSWGLYLRESSIASLSNYLISQGCNAATAWNVAHDFVLKTVEIQYLADCTLTKFDHFGWLFGGNPGLSAKMVRDLQGAAEIGAARAYQLIKPTLGKGSKEEQTLRPFKFKSSSWKSELANFFVLWFSKHLNAHVASGVPFSIGELVATIRKVLVISAPKKSPIGTALPIHYIP